jgi:DNA-binding IscR family transcriptional regulator
MAQNGRFGLSVRVLVVLALAPETMHTSAAIAETLKTSPVMVRRVFSALHKAGFIVQRKGPQGGAKLKVAAKSIGLGDVFAAASGAWLATGDKAVDAVLKGVRDDAVAAMNETTVGSLTKKLKKA